MIIIVGLNVSTVINLLSEYGVELCSGSSGLNREIDNVSVLEISYYEKSWIKGKEIILTTLSAFNDNRKIIKLIEDFHNLGVGAIGIHPGQNDYVELDDSVIEKSNLLGFPILILPRTLAYTVVFSEVLGSILNKQATILKKSEQISKEFTNIILKGGGINSITETLSDIIEKPVMILDDMFRVLAKKSSNEKDEILQQKIDIDEIKNIVSRDDSSSNLSRDYSYNVITEKKHILDNDYNIIVKIIKSVIDNDVIAYLIILQDNSLTDNEKNLDLLGLTHASTAIELAEVKKKAIFDTEMKLNFDFFDDLLDDNYESEETLVRRADYLGLTIHDKHAVIIIDIDDFERYFLSNIEKGEEHAQYIKKELNRIIRFAIRNNSGKKIILSKSDSYIVILQVNKYVNDRLIRQGIDNIAKEIHDKSNKKFNDLTVSIGVGSICPSLMELSKSYTEAKKSISIGKKILGPGNTIYYSELGIYNFFIFDNFNEFKLNCGNELIELMNQGKSSEVLLETLETFFDLNENVTRTAKKMFVHPNTIKYRINRIKDIIGNDYFNNNDNKLKLQISLKMRKYIINET